MSGKLKVLLTTEGTYPFHQGGVSMWCDILVQNLKDIDYTVYSVIMNPFVTQKFKLPENTNLIKVPLWGTEEPSEHLDTPFSLIYLKKTRTTPADIRERFIPLFTELVEEIIAENKDPHKFANTLLELHQYFEEYEYKVSFKSEITWKQFKEIILKKVNSDSKLKHPDVFGLIQSLGWIYRFMNILNTPVPRVDVSHSTAAAFCGIPCVLAKKKYDTPFMLTEHGVYLREQYLSMSKRNLSSYLNTFLIRLIHSITSLNFTFADQVSPVCYYNKRWETRFGVPEEKIKVIYNGIDKNVFTEAKDVHNINPTVVSVARIDPIKDIKTLIKAADSVKKQIPNVKFIVYGSVSVPEYYEECLDLVEKLDLKDTFIFAGHTNNMVAAYQSGDVFVLSSISEAFPYSVVEAMMVGKPVVATDVGGVREALGNTGILVTPREPEELASALTRFLKDKNLRRSMGQDARERALNHFTLYNVLEQHVKSYLNLLIQSNKNAIVTRTDQVSNDTFSQQEKKQQLYSERAFLLKHQGFDREAIEQFRLAIQVAPDHPAVPVYLSEISKAYNRLGEYHLAFNELDKIQSFINLNKQSHHMKPA